MAQHADEVRRVVGPVVEAAGLHLEDVTTSQAGNRSVVRITVDLHEDTLGSLDSDTLGEVSRGISAALDGDDVVGGAYTLEISTPGTSRPLTELRHFKRARTRLVTLRLTDGSTVEGRLVEVEGTDTGTDTGREADAELVLDDGTRVPFGSVAKGRVEVELKRLEESEAADAADGSDQDEYDEYDDGYEDDDAADADVPGVRESADADDDATQALDAGRNEEG